MFLSNPHVLPHNQVTTVRVNELSLSCLTFKSLAYSIGQNVCGIDFLVYHMSSIPLLATLMHDPTPCALYMQ